MDDDPFPAALAAAIDLDSSLGSPGLVLLAWVLAGLAATYRAALRLASRTSLTEEASSGERREFFERCFDREDELDTSLTLVQVSAEVCFVVFLVQALPVEGFSSWFGLAIPPAHQPWWALGLSAPILLLTVHALPRGLVRRQRAERLLRPALRPMYLWSRVTAPLSRLLLKLRGGPSLSVQGEASPPDLEHLTNEILDAVEESERAGAIEESEASMIEGVLELQDLQVSELMTPRTDMTTISIEASVEEAAQLAHTEGHSKVPVYQDNRDEIRGVFHLRDAIPILLDGKNPPLSEVMQEAVFVPETKKAVQLLHEFQESQQSLAIVLDEYGGTEGLITVEDIIEEIVGDLREEHDQEDDQQIQHLEQNVVSIDPRLRIEEINEELDLHLPESEDYDTVGGFVVCHLDHIPKDNEVFVYEGLEFKVLRVDQRRIARLQLRTLNRAG